MTTKQNGEGEDRIYRRCLRQGDECLLSPSNSPIRPSASTDQRSSSSNTSGGKKSRPQGCSLPGAREKTPRRCGSWISHFGPRPKPVEAGFRTPRLHSDGAACVRPNVSVVYSLRSWGGPGQAVHKRRHICNPFSILSRRKCGQSLFSIDLSKYKLQGVRRTRIAPDEHETPFSTSCIDG